METEKTPTHEESLAIILSMTKAAQKSFQDNSFHLLLWGWVILAASLSQYVLLEFIHFEKHYYAWSIIAVGIIGSMVGGYRDSQKVKVKSYIDMYLDNVWIAFSVSLFLVLIHMSQMGYQNAYGVIMALYGIGTFVTGAMLSFKPLKWGGIACWALAAITFHVDSSAILLLLALSVVLGYIIPGYLLKLHNKKENV